MGLAETHQTLLQNGLRDSVVVETDGKLMSGRDVAIAAILGAEEFGFATAPLVTLGCVMMRVCNLDTCPMGIATQNPELRKNFAGKPEYVERFMLFIARQLREYMAKLGVRTVDELVGRYDLIKVKDDLKGPAAKLDLSRMLGDSSPISAPYDKKKAYDFKLEERRDSKILSGKKGVKKAIEAGATVDVECDVENTDRAFGTMIGSYITQYHHNGLRDDAVQIVCKGAGGQSFGAFMPKGETVMLTGDANDYFGKGLSGGKLVIKAPEDAGYDAENNMIIGNVALYGATSGEAYIAGMAGERYCVRNSGARSVVEGVGEHGCEYMTGGVAVILGSVGKNFAAGMSGGIAYVLDEHNTLYRNLNKELVLMENVEEEGDIKEIRQMLEKHRKYTGSTKAKIILDSFDEYIGKFKKIIPEEYKRVISEGV